MTALVHKLNPKFKTLGVFNDAHIGILDQAAAKLMVECFEAEGVDCVIGNGDICDCGPVAPHELKARAAALENGSLLEEVATGRWLLDWMATRPGSLYGVGNHEDWINDLALRTNTVGSTTVASALALPASLTVLPHGYQIRRGSLVIEHGDAILGRGGGGVNLANTILTRLPDQTTVPGHWHRMGTAYRTSPDANGVPRTHAAIPLGHVSISTKHVEYAGRAPNWQQGFGIIRLWYESQKPRFTVYPIEIHRTRYNKPIFEFNGRIYS